MIFWLIYIATSFIIVLLLIDMKKPKNYPPGPSFLPIVGNYLLYRSMHKKLGYHHLVWTYLDKKYGDVVGMKLGRNYVIAASGPEAIREVLTREDFDGRPDGFFFRLRTFGKRLGIVFSDGQFWKKQRKFSLQHLRSFGFGRKEMEEMIQDETRSLIEIFENCCDRPIYMHTAFDVSVLNGLWAMMAGERFDIEDERLKKLLQIVNDAFRLVDMCGGLINQMPYLRHIAPNACGYNKIMDVLTRMWQFLEETIAEHRKTMSYMQQPRDLIDAFLQKMEYTNDTSFTDDQLMSLCLDLFMAGSETTSNSLGFSMLLMVLYPDVQRRVQDELDREVGRNRLPSLNDKPRLKYTEAVLMEIQRRTNIAPLGIAHRAVRDTNLGGYNIPEGTIVLTNLYSIHMNEKIWKDPLEFRPERFLDEKNEVVFDEKYFMPFGIANSWLNRITFRGSSMSFKFDQVSDHFPTLFLLYTNELLEMIFNPIYSFADDSILTSHMEPAKPLPSRVTLQRQQQQVIQINEEWGKRRCLGETLGKANIFLFFTAVLHNFTLDRVDGDNLSLEGFDGVTIAPKPFRVKLTPRC